MPRLAHIDTSLLLDRLVHQLDQGGPAPARALCAALGISQPTLSRLIAAAGDAVLRLGQGRETRYARRRTGDWGTAALPVTMVDVKGRSTVVAFLHPLAPQGYYLESHSKVLANRHYPHFPYLFEDLRPAGFLGRIIPRLHPELGVPEDITRWSDDHCLSYLARYGSDPIGNYLIGEASVERYVAQRPSQPTVSDRRRAVEYPRLAEQVLSHGIPGSSAAGEQPKFLTVRRTARGISPVLVKFSPPIGDALSRRVADLLVCEHIVHRVLNAHGWAAPTSGLINGGGRLFLEMERFDRTASGGRRGVLSLRAVDLEFVGQLTSWSETAAALLRQRRIDRAGYEAILWIEVFGRFIGNTDRHLGNLSFFCEGERLTGLAPVYDMLPTLYAPHQHQLLERTFEPPSPRFAELPVWNHALAAARAFWSDVQHHPKISAGFKRMTAGHNAMLAKCIVR